MLVLLKVCKFEFLFCLMEVRKKSINETDILPRFCGPLFIFRVEVGSFCNGEYFSLPEFPGVSRFARPLAYHKTLTVQAMVGVCSRLALKQDVTY